VSRTEAFALVAGGTVQAGGGVYLPRRADDQLLEHCRQGDFTYILTSRQMGKSSIMIRTAERLAAEGALPIIVDLTEFGAQTNAEQWFKGFLFAVQEQAGLRTEASEWWGAQTHHTYAHKFNRYLRDVALTERTERIVIFVDEIDTTLRLDFTDDFFTAIRFLYQHRAADPDLTRLSFVLIGVATPGDLIKDSTRTPFNIGHRIELTDFTLEEAAPLASHLPVPPALGREVIQSILKWTGGHPYLTLRAVRSLAESPPPDWTSGALDQRIRHLFFRAGADSDSNLQFVRDMLTKKPFDREAVLRTYGMIRSGRRVPDRELDQIASWLKLSGIVRRQNGALVVRNPVYEQVFDERWARDHLRLHVNWRRRLATIGTILLILTVLVTIPLAIYAWRQKTEAEFQARAAEERLLIAEDALAKRTQDLEAARRAAEKLRPFDPASAAIVDTQIANAQAEVQQDIAELATTRRPERKDAGGRPASPAAVTPRMAPPRPGDAASGRGSVAAAPTPDQIAIRRVLDAYQSAYATRDVKALQRVQVLSAAQQAAIAAELAQARQYVVRVDYADINVAKDGRHATVTAAVVKRIVGSGRMDLKSVDVFTLERRKQGWMIVSIRPA
jgi:hypothetical protein